ncbi:MAG TPA: zinc-binding dehydrogenase [Solirubrobacteraceae bacterium]|jgi:NADPH2:quinone reductase|nr:zinc-binding dehydrogenase [Solirubrobacteraceae bacterium]
MRAAVLREYGVPSAGEFAEPAAGAGQAVVPVLAAGVNPVDISISAGRFYAGKPPLPCVAGREGVGLLDGTRVYFDAPLAPFGSIAERALIDPRATHALPDAVADGVAIALGISGLAAWLALSWRARLAPGEHVLVLGASGLVGQLAVQAARLLGAGRVVAAARSREGPQRTRALGADAFVPLEISDELPAALQEAAEGRIDVVVDPLFGEPFAAAVQAASFNARLVHLGTAASPDATLLSAPIRGKMLTIMGHTNGAAPPEVKWASYEEMLRAAANGDLRVEVEPLPLERVAEAWSRVQTGSHRKVVVLPGVAEQMP